MRNLLSKFIYIFLSIALLAPVFLMASKVEAVDQNLIVNPSVEAENNGSPLGWTRNSWGVNTAVFDYTTGRSGNKGLSVTVTNYANGDAKWMAAEVPVSPGKSYTYKDYSKSNVMTELDIAFTDAAGNMSFHYLKSIPSSSTWQETISSFTVPESAVSASVYHIIYSNGSLQTDDFSLVADQQVPSPSPSPAPSPSPNPTPQPTANLITNESFESADEDGPRGWHSGGWGDNSPVFDYVANEARTGNRSARVSISNINSGDAKWYSNPVTITAGKTYQYKDYYKSDVVTRVVVAMTGANGDSIYQELAPAQVSDTWVLYSGSFLVPSGVQSVVVYHLLDKVGTLTIDDVSITQEESGVPTEEQPGDSTNAIANPSFETSNGSTPLSWQGEKWGMNTADFSYIENDAHTGNRSVKVTLSNYVDGDAKWVFSPLTKLTPGSQYSFSAWYKTNTQPHVVASYVNTLGTTQYLTLPNPLPNSNASISWQQYTTFVDMPIDAVSMTVFFLISSSGWLQTDDFSMHLHEPTGFDSPLISLTFDDGWSSIYSNGLPILKKYGFASTQYLVSGKLNTPNYMSTAMVKSLLANGHEIGSHTVTHPDLTSLSATQLTAELRNSKTKLRQLFGANVAQSFASPTGTYNTTTLNAIKQYYQSHRSTDVGFNSKDTFDPYNILVQNITQSTTPSDISEWVARAKKDKSWLVLVYHAVTDSMDSDEYAVTPSNLDNELSIIKNSGIEVMTVSQALARLKNQI